MQLLDVQVFTVFNNRFSSKLERVTAPVRIPMKHDNT